MIIHTLMLYQRQKYVASEKHAELKCILNTSSSNALG